MWDLIVSVPDHCLSFYLFVMHQSFVTTDRRPPPLQHTHTYGDGAGDSGANVRDIGLLSSPAAGLVNIFRWIFYYKEQGYTSQQAPGLWWMKSHCPCYSPFVCFFFFLFFFFVFFFFFFFLFVCLLFFCCCCFFLFCFFFLLFFSCSCCCLFFVVVVFFFFFFLLDFFLCVYGGGGGGGEGMWLQMTGALSTVIKTRFWIKFLCFLCHLYRRFCTKSSKKQNITDSLYPLPHPYASPQLGKGHIVLVPIQIIGIVVSVTFSCFRDLTRSDRTAELLALSKSDHGVSGLNPTGGEILSEAKRRFIALVLSCLHFHCSDMTEIRLKGTLNLS